MCDSWLPERSSVLKYKKTEARWHILLTDTMWQVRYIEKNPTEILQKYDNYIPFSTAGTKQIKRVLTNSYIRSEEE